MANYLKWADIVEVYSQTQLTFASDKLVAVGGISRQMKGSLKDTYVAGLWLGHLASEILWRADGDKEVFPPATGSNTYRAPSFSWASTDLAVVPGEPYLDNRILTDLCCVKYRPQHAAGQARQMWEDRVITEDLFGPFNEPAVELRVTGWVIPTLLVPSYGTVFEVHPVQFRKGRRTTGTIPTFSDILTPTPGQDEAANVVGAERASLDRQVFKVEMDSFKKKVYYYIPVRDADSHDETHFGNGPVGYCLLVEPIDERLGRFRRIGIFFLFNDARPRYLAPELRAGREDVPSWGYDEKTGKHTLYIV